MIRLLRAVSALIVVVFCVVPSDAQSMLPGPTAAPMPVRIYHLPSPTPSPTPAPSPSPTQASASAPAVSGSAAEPPTLKAILDARTSGSPGSGIVVVRVGLDDVAVTLSGASGTARPLDRDSLFEIGSVTKTFTATLLATMLLDGSVKLDDPISRYLPKTVRVPQFKGRSITLLDLATQHSGLPRLPLNLKDLATADPYAHYCVADMYAFLSTYKLTRAPGSSFEYSNYGIALLGQLLANRAHMSYADLLRKRVLAPLGMRATALSLSTVKPVSDTRLTVGLNSENDVVAPWTQDAIAPAGALRSTADDMTKFLRCNMGRGPLAKACLFAQRPRASMPDNRIGLVWWTGLTHGIVHHGGDTAGYHAAIAIAPTRTEGTVVLANGGLPVDDIAIHALIPSSPVAMLPVSTRLPESALSQYVGTYENGERGVAFTIGIKDGELSIQLTGQPVSRIYCVGKDEFVSHIVAARLKFVRDDAGQPVALVLEQYGNTIAFLRPGAVSPPAAALSIYPAVVDLDPATLASYVGEYASDIGTFYITLDGSHVLMHLDAQPVTPIFASAKDAFFSKVVSAQFEFERDSTNAVVRLTLVQDGRRIVAKRK